MRLDLAPGAVVVTLSKRNLWSLLLKLDEPGSQRTIVSRAVYDTRGVWIPGVLLVLVAETDEEHYADRPQPPGRMSAETEAGLRLVAHPDGWA